VTDDLPKALLPAMNVAVFTCAADGSFLPLAPPPPWFSRLADVTFPFLGHILEEARAFWRSGVPGSREYGPCAEEDTDGTEFHYRVKALTTADKSQFLVFELDRGSDRLRDALQTAREQALAREQHGARQRLAAEEIRRTADEMLQLLNEIPIDSGGPPRGLIDAMNAKCEALKGMADAIVEESQ
jgi:hypothetical protein